MVAVVLVLVVLDDNAIGLVTSKVGVVVVVGIVPTIEIMQSGL